MTKFIKYTGHQGAPGIIDLDEIVAALPGPPDGWTFVFRCGVQIFKGGAPGQELFDALCHHHAAECNTPHADFLLELANKDEE